MLEKTRKSVGLQGNQTSQGLKKSTLIFIGKSDAEAPILLPPHAKMMHRKRPWCWERWKAKEGRGEGWNIGWHHRFNGHGFEPTLGHGEGQGSLACWSPWVTKSQTQPSGQQPQYASYVKTGFSSGSTLETFWWDRVAFFYFWGHLGGSIANGEAPLLGLPDWLTGCPVKFECHK